MDTEKKKEEKEHELKKKHWTIDTLLLFAIVASLALLAIAGYKGFREEHGWHRSHTGEPTVIADITVNLGGVPKQEHCQTCHPEGKTADLSGRGAAASHPDISPHSIYDLGCTACHMGEGMAADLKVSHGRMGNETRKVLAGEAIQASCYQCHDVKPLKGAEKAWQGSRLFSETACNTCHTTGAVKGAAYGPDLSDAGSFLGLKQILTAIENPKAEPKNSIMPKFSLSPEEVKAISYFLKSRVKEPYHETPMIRKAKVREQERLEKRGPIKKTVSSKDLLTEKRCLACHKFGESDGQIGPDLSYMAFMRSTDYIGNFVERPGKEIPGAIMPRIPMSTVEKESIIRPLMQRREFHLHGGNSSKNIYMMLCQRCHAAQGDGFGTIEPNLANFPRAFQKNAEFFKAVPDERIIQSIEKGIPGTSMPPYGELLGRQAIDSTINLLFQVFVKTERMDKRTLTPPARAAVIPASEKIEATFRKECARCHGIQGKGKGPEYLKYLPGPRDFTNRPYFMSLSDDRIAVAISYGIPGTGMQAYAGKIPSESIWAMVGKIRTFSRQKEDELNGH